MSNGSTPEGQLFFFVFLDFVSFFFLLLLSLLLLSLLLLSLLLLSAPLLSVVEDSSPPAGLLPLFFPP